MAPKTKSQTKAKKTPTVVARKPRVVKTLSKLARKPAAQRVTKPRSTKTATKARKKPGLTSVAAWAIGLGAASVLAILALLLGPSERKESFNSRPETGESRRLASSDGAVTPGYVEQWTPFLQLIGAMSRPMGPELRDRVAFWSELLMNSSDATARLRELSSAVPKADTAPWIPGLYDCTTFVETVAALSRAKRPEDVWVELARIRYRDSAASYASRNHFPEADWIPNNTRNGMLRDLTLEVGGEAGVGAERVSKKIEKRKWLSGEVSRGRVGRSIASVDDQAWNDQVATVSYLPIDRLERFAARIPSGTILNVVHADLPGRAVLITHQGFVVRSESGEVLFRHANPGGRMRTEPLSAYFKAARAKPSGRSIVGVNLQALQE